MNTILKSFVSIGFLTSLIGCAAPVPYRGDTSYQGSYGSYNNSSNEGPRTTPCHPFNADPLMNWAGGLDGGKQRSRFASVNVQNGSVNCTQNESASSQMTTTTTTTKK